MFDTEFLAVQIALAVLLGLNLLVALLLWSEYADNRSRFLKFMFLSQASVLAWHGVSAGLVYLGELPVLQSLSLVCFFLLAYFMLLAVTEKLHSNDRRLYQIAAAVVVLEFGLGLISLDVLNAVWFVNILLMFSLPVVTVMYFKQVAARPITIMQTVIAVMFLASSVFFNTDNPDLGGLCYMLVGLFQPILSVLFMISSIRLSRRQVALRERDYRVFFESINEVFFRIDLNGRVEEISPSVSQFGISPESITGRKLQNYLVDSADFFKLLNSMLSGRKPITYRGSFRAGDSQLDCEVICSKIEDAETGRSYFAGAISNTQERNLLERQFIEAQRHESLGVLAGGMAHDFNNLLQGIIGYTELMQEARDLDQETRNRGFNAILKAAMAAGELCKQLLQYTGKGLRSRDTFSLTDEINEVLEIMRPSCPDAVSISAYLPDHSAWIQGDRSQVGQIVLNLVRNALDAVGDSGEISLHVTTNFLNEKDLAEANLPRSLVPGNYHELAISDNGPGINEQVLNRIFDPFFSTKEKGHGLGLSAVKGILKIHQGAITVRTEPGDGTVFRVFLPAQLNHVEADAANKPHQSVPGMPVLLVEDDVTVQEVAGQMLERAGYQVLTANDGVDALRVLGLAREPVRLVVTDVKMPNMDGIELAYKLRQQIPDIPLVLMSGYADVSEAMERAQSLTFQFVAKPFRGDELVCAVEKAVEHLRLRDSQGDLPFSADDEGHRHTA